MANIIPVDINDLYANGYVVELPDAELLLLRDKVSFVPDDRDRWHSYVAGQRLDQLAYQYYRDDTLKPSRLWWAIADANNIHDPFNLSDYVGKLLLIPAYSKIIANT